MKEISEYLYQNNNWLMSRKEISKFLKLSERTISTMMAVDDLPYLRVRGRVLFDPVKVKKFMSRYEVNSDTSKWIDF